MKPRARKALEGAEIVAKSGFFERIAENRRAKNAGKPKPYTVLELLFGAAKVARDVAEKARGDEP